MVSWLSNLEIHWIGFYLHKDMLELVYYKKNIFVVWILYLIRQKPFCVLWIQTTPPIPHRCRALEAKVTKTKSTADAPGATIKKAFRNCYKMNCIICRNKPVTLESMFVGAKFIPHFKDLLGVLCWLQQLCNSLAGLKHLVFSFNILFKYDFHLHLCSVSE